MLLASPLDPKFLLLPFLLKSEKFSPLDQIIKHEDGCAKIPLEWALDWCLEDICDVKDLDDMGMFYRLNQSKTLNWLRARTAAVAHTLGKQRATRELLLSRSSASRFNASGQVKAITGNSKTPPNTLPSTTQSLEPSSSTGGAEGDRENTDTNNENCSNVSSASDHCGGVHINPSSSRSSSDSSSRPSSSFKGAGGAGNGPPSAADLAVALQIVCEYVPPSLADLLSQGYKDILASVSPRSNSSASGPGGATVFKTDWEQELELERDAVAGAGAGVGLATPHGSNGHGKTGPCVHPSSHSAGGGTGTGTGTGAGKKRAGLKNGSVKKSGATAAAGKSSRGHMGGMKSLTAFFGKREER